VYAGHPLGLGFWLFFDASCALQFSPRSRDNRLLVTGMLENSPLMPPNCRRVANPKA